MPNAFTTQLRALGIKPGDVVLMHSSMKALGTRMSPEAFLHEVIAALGPDGTLLLPALTYDNVTADQPLFSAKQTEPCIGLLPRVFFRMEGVVRSLHPTHSVCAYGKKAEELTSSHILDDTPVGSNSPFMLLRSFGGKLLFIGDLVGSCTFMHGIEEMAGVPYALTKERTRFIIENGNQMTKEMICHDFAGIKQEYHRILDILAYPDIRKGNVGNADCTLIDANALAKKALQFLADDPYYFVSRVGEPV